MARCSAVMYAATFLGLLALATPVALQAQPLAERPSITVRSDVREERPILDKSQLEQEFKRRFPKEPIWIGAALGAGVGLIQGARAGGGSSQVSSGTVYAFSAVAHSVIGAVVGLGASTLMYLSSTPESPLSAASSAVTDPRP